MVKHFWLKIVKILIVFGQFNCFFINHTVLEYSCFIFNGSLKWTVSLKLFIKVVGDTMRERYTLKTIEFVIIDLFSFPHALLAAFNY